MPLYQTIREAARSTGAKLIVVDNIAQCFGGNENIRVEVTAFVNALSGLALELDAAVLLLGHPGKASDSEYSGSTALMRRCVALDPNGPSPIWTMGRRASWPICACPQSESQLCRHRRRNPDTLGEGAFRPEGAARIKDTVDRIEERLQEKADDAFLTCLMPSGTGPRRQSPPDRQELRTPPDVRQGRDQGHLEAAA